VSKLLNTDQQIEKLNFLDKLAEGSQDSDLLDKLGSVIIYNGLVEFYAVQAARLLEQGILKSQLHEQKEPSFKPHEDSWFYDKQISTRRILKEIKKFLPLKDKNTGQEFDDEVTNFLKSANEFLNYRNSLIHRLASPRTDLEGVEHCVNKLIQIYQQVVQTHRIMFETLGPYRFSEKEIDFFYGKRRQS
jgi:hypothetical protein